MRKTLDKDLEQKLSEEFKRQIIPGEPDLKYMQKQVERAKKYRIINNFFESIEVKGLENLAVEGQKIYLMNHLSLFDFIALGYVLIDNSIEMPRLVAGKNLDLPLLAQWPFNLDFRKFGAFFVNRDIKNNPSREEVGQYSKSLRDLFEEEILYKGYDTGIFPEGGRNAASKKERIRDINKRVQTPKPGFLNYISAWKGDALIVPTAFEYDDRIEEDFFGLIKYFRPRKNPLQTAAYYATDAAAFISRFLTSSFQDTGNCYINFGKPVYLSEIRKQEKLGEFFSREVKNLYNEIISKK